MIRKLLIILVVAAALSAHATPQRYDANDLWVDYNELGWGLNLFHQGDTLFASLFVYGPDGKPRWYTGSNLVGDDGGVLHDRPAVYSGALVESTGPGIGAPFDPALVTRRQVGSLSVELGGDSGGSYAWVSYDVDGVRITNRKLRRFTFGNMGLTGTYTGYQADLQKADNMNAVFITLEGTSFSMGTYGLLSGSCSYAGTRAQDGSQSSIEGNYSCNDGRSGKFSMGAVDVTRHGFTASFSGNMITGSYSSMVAQRTSGNIRGDGYSTDLWFIPNESGWGFNVVEQGDTLFGTLFVYDAQGKAHWYSASNLTYEQCAPPDAASDCNARYRGALVESTGPYFGTSFNAAAVQRRQVGTVTFDRYGAESANLFYTVDGVSVTKQQLRRAGFRTNSLAGSYVGHMEPFVGTSDRGLLVGPMTIDISDVGNNLVMTMRGSGRTCSMQGNRTQIGRQVWAAGPYTCGGGSLGDLMIGDVYVTWSGFTGFFSLNGQPVGRIEAVRTTAR